MITRLPTPFGMLPHTAVITPPTITVGDSGSPAWTWPSGAVTVRACLQPVSSRDGLQYGRETGTSVYEVFTATVDTSGAAITLTDAQFKNSKVVIEGKTLRVVGTKVDPISNGCVFSLTCEEDY